VKQKDLALVAVIAIVSGILALVVSRWLFGSPQNTQQKAEVVDVITADFPQPPSKYFNTSAVNPTQQIEIGASSNPNPFNAKSQ
jgi:hypothetical protein